MYEFLLVFILLLFLLASSVSVYSQDNWKDYLPCKDGEKKACGSNVGACEGGTQMCSGGSWRACDAEVYPSPEICGNGIDDDCNGLTDECLDFIVYILVGLGVMLFVIGFALSRY